MADGFKVMAIRSMLVERQPTDVWTEFEVRQDEEIVGAEGTSSAYVTRVWIVRKVRDV